MSLVIVACLKNKTSASNIFRALLQFKFAICTKLLYGFRRLDKKIYFGTISQMFTKKRQAIELNITFF